MDFGNELQNITYLPTNFEMELTHFSEMSITKSICVVKGNQYKRRRFYENELTQRTRKTCRVAGNIGHAKEKLRRYQGC